jgi:hypothetical protein
MSEIKKCTTCSFKAPVSDWELSVMGKSFKSCVKCREYHRNHRKHDDEARLNKLEMLRIKYNTDEAFRRRIADRSVNRTVVYVLCDYCGKNLKHVSLAPHLLRCKNKKSPELAMLKRLSDVL